MISEDSFLTIGTPGEAIYKDKGSKFLGFSYAATTEQEVKNYLLHKKKEYYDAKHHCYGVILGFPIYYIKAHDAGEPAHTAGDPILNQIKSRNLTNTIVLVIRYFGGTKLGVGGLIHAYKETAALALNNATIITGTVTKTFSLLFNFELTDYVMKTIKQFNCKILKSHLSTESQLTVIAPIKNYHGIKEKLINMNGIVFIDVNN